MLRDELGLLAHRDRAHGGLDLALHGGGERRLAVGVVPIADIGPGGLYDVEGLGEGVREREHVGVHAGVDPVVGLDDGDPVALGHAQAHVTALAVAAVGLRHDVVALEGGGHRKGVASLALNRRVARARVVRSSLVPLPRDMRVGGNVSRARFGGCRNRRSDLDLARRRAHGHTRDIDRTGSGNKSARRVSQARRADLRRHFALEVFAAQSISKLEGLSRSTRDIGIRAVLGVSALPLEVELVRIDERRCVLFLGTSLGGITDSEYGVVGIGVDERNRIDVNRTRLFDLAGGGLVHRINASSGLNLNVLALKGVGYRERSARLALDLGEARVLRGGCGPGVGDLGIGRGLLRGTGS